MMAVVVDRSRSKGELAGAKGQADQGLDEGGGLFAADSRWDDDVVNNELEGTWLVKALGSTAEWELIDRPWDAAEEEVQQLRGHQMENNQRKLFGFQLGPSTPFRRTGRSGLIGPPRLIPFAIQSSFHSTPDVSLSPAWPRL